MKYILPEAMSLLLLVSFAALTVYAQEENTYPAKKSELGSLEMSYRNEGAQMPFSYVQLNIEGTGKCRLEYSTYPEYKCDNDNDEIIFNMDRRAVMELSELYRKADFYRIEINDLNREKITVTDVGTTSLSYSFRGKERKVSYGYVENEPLSELVKFYSNIMKKHLPKTQRLPSEE
ncbi:MAG: hypothetical protein A2314_08545 [Elusimicrobia bacterium RIFOXYB2_FULL_50_12]|nr:MAG: hypothetical protein A2314_08545 [Elusimicrobia bacterium RIFOXYB2_FULL_50_12]